MEIDLRDTVPVNSSNSQPTEKKDEKDKDDKKDQKEDSSVKEEKKDGDKKEENGKENGEKSRSKSRSRSRNNGNNGKNRGRRNRSRDRNGSRDRNRSRDGRGGGQWQNRTSIYLRGISEDTKYASLSVYNGSISSIKKASLTSIMLVLLPYFSSGWTTSRKSLRRLER